MDSLTREDYNTFVEELFDFLHRSNLNVCFYGYGSFIEGDFVPEISDLDGGLILDSQFVTSKDFVHKLSARLESLLRETDLKIQFNLMDRSINRDGRFLAYDDTYTKHLKEKCKIFHGPDFMQEMKGMNYKREALRSTAYNLRKVRNGLLMHFVNVEKDPLKARKNIFSSRKILWDTQKKLVELATGRVVFKEDQVFETFKRLFPNYETESLEKARYLKRNPQHYFKDLGNLESRTAFELSKEFVTATELMIKEYVKKYPSVTNYEVTGPPIIL